jgi:hypothetical protein
MRDILSQGEDRQPGRRPRLLAATAVLAAVLTVVIVQHLPRHRAAPARPPRAAATARPGPPAGSAAALPAPGLPGEPDGVIGQGVLRDGSLRLPVSGAQPAWFWPATGRMQPVAGLPPERSGYLFARAGGGWAIQPEPAAAPGCGSCAGPPRPVYFLADRAQSVTRIGVADEIAPGGTAGGLWLTSYPQGADMSTAAGTAREVSVAGAPLTPPLRLPAGYLIDRATDRGLLLAPAIQRRGTTAYKLWDPAAPHASRTFDGVIAAGATGIAWTPRCARRCLVHVLDLRTGRATVVRLPAGSSAANGAFSPDGGFLALQVSFGSGGDGGALAMQLEVASAATGRLTVVPGTWVSSDALVGFGWPASGDSLVAELSFTTKVQVASWRPGAARLAVAVIKRGQESASLIVG